MELSNLVFKNYHAEEICFHIDKQKEKIDINDECDNNLKIEIGVGQSNRQFAVKLTYDKKDINGCCDLKVVLVGFFEIKKDAKGAIDEYASNAIAILFPYLRSTITTITSVPGIEPIVLPIINCTNME